MFNTPSFRSKQVILYLLFVCALLAPSLAFAPPPPPDPAVPAGNLFTEYMIGFGVAGYGVWALWRSRRASDNKENNKEDK